MAGHVRWEDIKKRKGIPDGDAVARVKRDLVLGQAIFDARTEAGLTQHDLAERLKTTAGVIARVEEGGGTA